MRLLIDVLGALFAGALIVVFVRRLGVEVRRAYGAVALIAVSVATVVAIPTLRQDASSLLHQRSEYAGMSAQEAQVRGGANLGVDVAFLGWVHEHLGEGETFHLEIGKVEGEEEFVGTGVTQATTFAWATFQLAPNLSVEQSSSATDIEPGEGESADWIVFYGMDPSEYPGKLGKIITYEPNFAMARTANAG